MAAQSPAGWLIVCAARIVAIGSFFVVNAASVPSQIANQIAIGLAAAFVAPTVNAITRPASSGSFTAAPCWVSSCPWLPSRGRVYSLADIFRKTELALFVVIVIVFHFSNAAMLPLAGQELARTPPGTASLYMSAGIVIAQAVMVAGPRAVVAVNV